MEVFGGNACQPAKSYYLLAFNCTSTHARSVVPKCQRFIYFTRRIPGGPKVSGGYSARHI